MIDFIKMVFIVSIMYILDIVIWGSIIGILFIISSYISSLLNDTSFLLWKEYLRGIVLYWVIDSFASKFREIYKEYKELK